MRLKKIARLASAFQILFLSLAFAGPGRDALEANLEEYLSLTRDALTRPNVREFLRDVFREEQTQFFDTIRQQDGNAPRTRDITETQFLLLLQENPDLVVLLRQYLSSVPRIVRENESDALTQRREEWKQRFKAALARPEIRAVFSKLGDPTVPFELNQPGKDNNYRDLEMYVNHPWKKDGVSQPISNLKQIWINMIRSARQEIMLNVYDFDLMDIADELVAAKARGLKVVVGIDKGVIEEKPEVKAVFDRLRSGDVDVHAVDAVRLNHQKLMVTDWSNPRAAKVLMSSGNPTQSCIGPEGDLPAANPRPRESIPNANHIITLKGQTLALLIHHELVKTLEKPYQLRGREYPLGGTFMIHGLSSDSNPIKSPHVLMAFSPNGGFDAVGKQVIGKIIKNTSGPLRMAQFAFSSHWVEEALFERAKADKRAGRRFDFKFVGETPFAMMDWSIPLEISGLLLERTENSKQYKEIPNSKWKRLLGAEGLADLRRNIKIAPRIYRTSNIIVNEVPTVVVAKLHHKILVTGKRGKRYGITGSFNFSTGAEENQENIAAFQDERVSEFLTAIVDSLHEKSRASIFEEAQRRNSVGEFDNLVDVQAAEQSDQRRNPNQDCNQQLRSSEN